MGRTLYICYFGLREPLVQTQVLPYLIELVKDGTEISLLTFEPDPGKNWTEAEIKTERERLRNEGIRWSYLPYHKRPSVPATFYDIVNGAREIRRLHKHQNFDLLHCRVHVPMLMAAIPRKFSSKKPKLLFDIRGFFPEEYTDAGVWPENGWIFRMAKRVEKWLLKEADGFVVLTEKARGILFPEITSDVDDGPRSDRKGRPVEVIPCCVDTKRFEAADENARNLVRRELGIGNRFVIAYAGSFGGWYLSDEMVDLFATALRSDPNTFIMILTQRNTETVEAKFRTIGFRETDFLVRSVAPADMPRYLAAADAGVSFIKPCYSKQASSPTKNAEYLASGLPIIANIGIGDVDVLISNNDVGVLVDTMTRESYEIAIRKIREFGDIRERCSEVAQRDFDLVNVGGKRYRRLYRALMGNDDA